MPNLSKPKILELARGDWIDQKFNCCLVGSHGTGKTHVSVGVTVHRGICASSARTATGTNDDGLVRHGTVPQLYPRRAA
jgi:IstB-like ATP binding protein